MDARQEKACPFCGSVVVVRARFSADDSVSFLVVHAPGPCPAKEMLRGVVYQANGIVPAVAPPHVDEKAN